MSKLKITSGHSPPTLPQYITHAGSVPGFSAEIYVLPADGVAVVALSNGDMKHGYEQAVILRIIEDLLGLERIESERIIAKLREENAVTQETGESVTLGKAAIAQSPLSLPLHQYAGRYYDSGYDNLTLCARTSHPPPECSDVLSAWSAFENVTDAESLVLYASVSSSWITHFRFSHRSGDTFDLEAAYLFPRGYGKDKSPFQTAENEGPIATVEFVVRGGSAGQGMQESGAAIVGAALRGFVGETTERQRVGGSVADTAEIWWEKA